MCPRLVGAEPASDKPLRWSPGEPSTSELRGQVQARDDALEPDGVYGRFAGDVSLALNLGAELESGITRGLVQASAHYFWMAGLVASYREPLGSTKDASNVGRIGSLGVDIRPMFIPRWSFDWQRGPALLDLVIDSISLFGGAYFADASRASPAARRGFEASIGVGIPLMMQASGPWLSCRYTQRWPEAGDLQQSVWLMLGWHGFVSTPLAASTGDVD